VTVGAFGAQQRALVRERCEFTTVRPVPVRGHDHDADGAGQEVDELDRCAQPAAPHGLSNRSRTYRKAATQESSARKSKEFSGRGSSYLTLSPHRSARSHSSQAEAFTRARGVSAVSRS
jgi:hypothetical protein